MNKDYMYFSEKKMAVIFQCDVFVHICRVGSLKGSLKGYLQSFFTPFG